MTDFKKRVYSFNHLHGMSQPHSLPPSWFSTALKMTKRQCPDPPMAGYFLNDRNCAADAIYCFQEKAIEDFADEMNTSPKKLYKQLKIIEKNQHRLAHYQQERFDHQDRVIEDVQQTSNQIIKS